MNPRSLRRRSRRVVLHGIVKPAGSIASARSRALAPAPQVNLAVPAALYAALFTAGSYFVTAVYRRSPSDASGE